MNAERRCYSTISERAVPRFTPQGVRLDMMLPFLKRVECAYLRMEFSFLSLQWTQNTNNTEQHITLAFYELLPDKIFSYHRMVLPLLVCSVSVDRVWQRRSTSRGDASCGAVLPIVYLGAKHAEVRGILAAPFLCSPFHWRPVCLLSFDWNVEAAPVGQTKYAFLFFS